MKGRRVFLPAPLPPSLPGDLPLDDATSHYVTRVLRLSTGAAIWALGTDGRFVSGTLGKHGEFWVLHVTDAGVAPESASPVALWVGLMRPQRWDWLVEKAVELGADALWALECAHSVVRVPQEKRSDRQKRWQREAGEAARQCGRQRVPEVKGPLSLHDALRSLDASDHSDASLICLDPEAPLLALSDLAPSLAAGPVVLASGPEGGWAREERSAFAERGFLMVHLGSRVLRAETAPLAALSAVAHSRGWK